MLYLFRIGWIKWVNVYNTLVFFHTLHMKRIPKEVVDRMWELHNQWMSKPLIAEECDCSLNTVLKYIPYGM